MGHAHLPRRPGPPAGPDCTHAALERDLPRPPGAGRALRLARLAHARFRGRQGVATRAVRPAPALPGEVRRPALRRPPGHGAGAGVTNPQAKTVDERLLKSPSHLADV